jgi:uncharacterized protein YndB with AHSA1/START domain
MSDGVLVTGGGRPAVRIERILEDPPEVVWRALTDREELKAWFPCDVVVDGGEWTVGAKVSFPFPSEVIEMTLLGVVLEVDEPHVLAYTWGDDVLRFELTATGRGTTLAVVNELSPEGAARNAAGWDECLDRLAGIEVRKGAWQPRFEAYAVAFEPRLGVVQEGPPSGYKGE